MFLISEVFIFNFCQGGGGAAAKKRETRIQYHQFNKPAKPPKSFTDVRS